MITPGMKRRLKRKFSAEKPTIHVGKEGATSQIINEISRQLEQHEVVKAKILQTALKDVEAKEIATKIANQTDATIIEVRGHTFILYKKRKRKQIAPVSNHNESKR
jgi:RNA-binding protein